MSPRILVETSPGEWRIAVAAEGELLDFALWRPGLPDGVGDLYLGRVIARVPAMGGAFVALPGAEGFLPDAAGGKAAGAGDLLPVEVTRAAQGGKGPRLSAAPARDEGLSAGGEAPKLLRRGPNPVFGLAARYPKAPVLAGDPAVVARLRSDLGSRISLRTKAFDTEIADQVAALAAPEFTLPGGGRMHIWPTPALTAIDLDAGAASADRRDKRAAQAALNQAAIPALARQIRLRNLSGAIYVDFAGMAQRHRVTLAPALTAALAADPVPTRLLGFTALGLAEILRARVHPPLHELLAGPYAAGLAALARAEAELARSLQAAPDVVHALAADPVALAEFEHRTGWALMLRSDPALPAGTWKPGAAAG